MARCRMKGMEGPTKLGSPGTWLQVSNSVNNRKKTMGFEGLFKPWHYYTEGFLRYP